MNRVLISPITRALLEVVKSDADENSSPHALTSTRKWVFSCLKCRFRETSQNSFPYSLSGFNAEPSQSAQRPHANPAAVQSGRHGLPRGTTVCVLFCEIAGPPQRGPVPNARCALWALNGDAGRAFSFSALSSNSPGSRPFKPRDAGATPVRAAIFLKEAPVLDPRLEPALPYRIHQKPAGGPSPAGAEFTMRSWRKSNAPVCQSGVGSASLPERTTWSCGVQQ